MNNRSQNQSKAPTNTHTPMTDAQKTAQAQAQQNGQQTQQQQNDAQNIAAEGPATATVEKTVSQKEYDQLASDHIQLIDQLAAANGRIAEHETTIQTMTVKLEEHEKLTKDGTIKRNGGDTSATVSTTDANTSQAPNVDAAAGPGIPVHEIHTHKGGSEQVIEVSNRPAETVETTVK